MRKFLNRYTQSLGCCGHRCASPKWSFYLRTTLLQSLYRGVSTSVLHLHRAVYAWPLTMLSGSFYTPLLSLFILVLLILIIFY